MANRKVTLTWYCRTANGWRRFPVILGKNNRVKHGFVLDKGVEAHYPDGRYELRMYEGSKLVYKRAGANASDAKAAQERETHLRAAKGSAKAAGAKIVEEPGRVYLRRAANDFVKDAEQRQAMEAAEVARNVTDEFIAVTRKTFADEITRDDIFRFHKALRDRGCGDRTVANKHARLKSFFRFLKMDYQSIMPPTPKYDETLPTIYTAEETKAILGGADPYLRLALELGLKCGLRDMEIMHAEWPDIHWNDNILRVTSKPHWKFKIKDSEERDVPLGDEVLQHLKERQEGHKASRLILPTAGGKPNGKLLRLLKKTARAAGLNCGMCDGCSGPAKDCQHWTLHKFRRTYCTTLLRNQIDLRTTQAFMGHADLASTMRYLKPATSKESQAKINAIRWD